MTKKKLSSKTADVFKTLVLLVCKGQLVNCKCPVMLEIRTLIE